METNTNEPFDVYQLEVDKETEEVYLEAWDSGAPQDVFRSRVPLESLLAVFRRLNRGLERS